VTISALQLKMAELFLVLKRSPKYYPSFALHRCCCGVWLMFHTDA